jgi:hypothetical protein
MQVRQLLSQVGSLDLAVAELRLGLSEGEAVLRRRGGAGARREVDARQLSEEDTVDEQEGAVAQVLREVGAGAGEVERLRRRLTQVLQGAADGEDERAREREERDRERDRMGLKVHSAALADLRVPEMRCDAFQRASVSILDANRVHMCGCGCGCGCGCRCGCGCWCGCEAEAGAAMHTCR